MPATVVQIDEEMRRIAEQRRQAAEARRQRERATEEAVQQIQETRKEIETLAARLQEQANTFRSRSRRTLDEESSSHVVFANAHLRFAGAILQGLRRTAFIDRTLEIGRVEREEARQREERELQERQARDSNRQVEQLQLPTDDAMTELYGDLVSEEEAAHA